MSEREWGEAITEDGRRYYFNTVTGHTQWEVPIGWQQQLGGMQQQQQQQPSTAIINNSANNNNNSNNSNFNFSPQDTCRHSAGGNGLPICTPGT